MLLGLVVLWGLQPWEDDSGDPQLVPLGIEMAVDDGQALPAGPAVSVAAGRVAPAGPKLVVQAAEPVERGAKAAPSLAVAPSQAIAAVEAPSSPQSPHAPAPESGTGGEVPSGGATDGEAPSEGTSPPVTVPVSTGGGTPGGPVASGGGPTPESCDSNEYLITVTFLEEEAIGEESAVEIVLQHLDEDGNVDDELRLEGDLNDARSLVLKLSSEGSCVEVEIAQPDEEGEGEEGDGEEEAPEAGEEEAGSAELPEPVSP